MPYNVAILTVSFFFIYKSLDVLYLLLYSPLSQYPGPKLYTISKIPINYHRVNGSIIKRLGELHRKYGSVVRIGPTELSYIDPVAWNDIYGFKNESIGRQMPKDPAFYSLDPSADSVNMDADLSDVSHGRQRKVFSHAFSDRALREQEGLVATYVDKLVEKLGGLSKSRKTTDLVRMLNFTTFDIMSDLAFGQPLDLLEYVIQCTSKTELLALTPK